MKKDACFELGYITKAHGLQGEVVVFLDTDHPENYIELESVFVEVEQRLVPFFIESLSATGDKAILKFEDVDSLEDATALKGCALFLPLSALPPLEGKSFYFHEVIGFTLNDSGFGPVGTIKDVLDANAQYLFAVDHKSLEVLVPVNDYIINSIDRDNQTINVTLPEGLLDIYLNDED